jgi:hypothetical protein
MSTAIDKPTKKTRKTSPTARTLAHFEKRGIVAGVVEKRNWFAGPPQFKCGACGKNRIGRTNDFLGFVDVIACMNGYFLAVQVTSDANLTARFKKIVEEPRSKVWLDSGGRIEVHGWAKKGGKGKRKLWSMRTVEVTLADLPPLPNEESDPEARG